MARGKWVAHRFQHQWAPSAKKRTTAARSTPRVAASVHRSPPIVSVPVTAVARYWLVGLDGQ